VDALEAVPVRLGRRRLEDSAIVDDEGAVRLLVPTPGWDELVDLALTEVRWYGAGTPQVAWRLAALFAAGVITRQLLTARELPAVESKLTAVGLGVFVPFFFIVSGMKLGVAALFASVGGVAKMALFLALFLIVRGAPALLLYRTVLDRRERIALALLSSTQLPLVVAIATGAST
jgi:hypothetical protein